MATMGRKRVLVIDDEQDIREIAKISLEITRQWDIFTASSGQEGIAIAIAQLPDAILLDMSMPEMNGLLTLEALRANPSTQSIPVLFLTATTQASAAAKTDEADVQGVLIKPFDPGTLGEQIEAKLGWH